MNTRCPVVLLLVAACLAISSWSAAALPPPPSAPGATLPPSPPWSASGMLPPWRAGPVRPLAAAGGPPADIPLGQPGLAFRYAATLGTVGAPYYDDPDHLNLPYGVGTDGETVWIAEASGRRALHYASDGTFLEQIGVAGVPNVYPRVMPRVDDVAVDAAGQVWIADSDAAHVLVFDANLEFVRELGREWERGDDNEHFAFPVSVAFDAAGNIYVSDGAPEWTADEGNHRIQIFDADGNWRHTLGVTGEPGTDNDHFHGPRHITIYGDRLFVADSGNHRVQIFDISDPDAPTFVHTIGVTGESGDDDDHLNNPSGVAVEPYSVLVADTSNNRIQAFYNQPDYAYLLTLANGDYEFNNPTDVAVDAGRNIYVADYWNFRVQQYDYLANYLRTYGTTGVPYLTDASHFNHPSGTAAGPDGSLYVAEQAGHRLLKFTRSGDLVWTFGEAGVPGGWEPDDTTHLSWPSDVVVDGTGRAYVADSGNARIRILRPDGTFDRTLGEWGDGNGQFCYPAGVGLGPNGFLYVADNCLHRVQIFNANLEYVATLGETGVSGDDDSHFNAPEDVAVDGTGVIYVADSANYRVQVFGADRAYIRTIGVTGEWSDDHDGFNWPHRLAIDTANRLYVADRWNHRIQVFDAAGGYLTTVGGRYGDGTGELTEAWGVAVDGQGALYVADWWTNFRVQKYTQPVPGWRQVNLNGFGRRGAEMVSALAPFGGALYAGIYNPDGAELWRMSAAGAWTPITTNGFGDPNNRAVDHLIEFKGYLYAGTWNESGGPDGTDGAQVWRSPSGDLGSWTRVVANGFGQPSNGEVLRFGVFGDYLYAATWSYSPDHGTEIWRSSTGNAGSWSRVVANGFGNPANNVAPALAVHGGMLYVGTLNLDFMTMTSTGAEVWRSATGNEGSWTQVNVGGFGNAHNFAVSALAPFKGKLYAAVLNQDFAGGTSTGGQLWRCTVCDGSDWSPVITDGFGNPKNGLSALIVFQDRLYAVTSNSATGLEVWRSATGNPGDWTRVNEPGFGSNLARGTWYGNAVAQFGNRLYIGTNNRWGNGGQVWVRLAQVYLPLVRR